MKTIILSAAIAALLLTAATAQCPSNESWTLRSDSCYKWFTDPHYWFDAEQVCLSHQAHLVSIQSESENTLVARLAQCTHVWIGRFGTKLNQLNDPSSYEWTDGSNAASFQRHNFTGLDNVHKSHIRSDGEWWLNSLYHERHPFVCEQRANATTSRCPNGWTLFNNHCYLMPEFESNFNEANFYCQRKSSQLVSVLSESELSHINKVIFGIGACNNPLDTVWIGLIKLNPCFPDSGGHELCYQWTDFSGKHLGFPKWHAGHPNNSDWTVNCVTLTGDGVSSDRCHNRHRFVCKSPAGNDTDGGGGAASTAPSSGSTGMVTTATSGTTLAPVNGVVAAFDFRKGLDNLVDPRTYVVRDDFGVPRTKEDGACFNYTTARYYRIGQPVDYNESLMGQPEWTLFVRSWLGVGYRVREVKSSNFINLAQPDYIGNVSRSEFLASHFETEAYTYLETAHFEYPESHQKAAWRHVNYYRFYDTCGAALCNLAISMNKHGAVFRLNGMSDPATHMNFENIIRQRPDTLGIALGALGNRGNRRYCVSCFGIAHKQLSSQELQRAFSTYCP